MIPQEPLLKCTNVKKNSRYIFYAYPKKLSYKTPDTFCVKNNQILINNVCFMVIQLDNKVSLQNIQKICKSMNFENSDLQTGFVHLFETLSQFLLYHKKSTTIDYQIKLYYGMQNIENKKFTLR